MMDLSDSKINDAEKEKENNFHKDSYYCLTELLYYDGAKTNYEYPGKIED